MSNLIRALAQSDVTQAFGLSQAAGWDQTTEDWSLAIEMNPDGSKAYVACTPDSYVVVVDLKTLEAASHLDAGKNPDAGSEVVRPAATTPGLCDSRSITSRLNASMELSVEYWLAGS